MCLLLPAYGRVYTAMDQAVKDWVLGKDFHIFEGPYCSIRDVEKMRAAGHKTVTLSWVQDNRIQTVTLPI